MMVYGVFILLLIMIPNRMTGRLCFLSCGGIILAVGVLLHRAGKGRPSIGAVAAT